MSFYAGESQQKIYVDYDGIATDVVVDIVDENLLISIGSGSFFENMPSGSGLVLIDQLSQMSRYGKDYKFHLVVTSDWYGLSDDFRREIQKQKFAFFFNKEIHIDVEMYEEYSKIDNGTNLFVSARDEKLSSWTGPKVKFETAEQAYSEIMKNIT